MLLAWVAAVLLSQAPEAKAEIIYEENLPPVADADADGGSVAETFSQEKEAGPAASDAEPQKVDATSATAGDEGGATKTVTSQSTQASPVLSPRNEPEKAPRGRSLFRGAVELTAHSLPSGTPEGRQDLFGNVLPIISVDTGDAFGFELGAVLRLRLLDDLPVQRAGDHAGLLRGADWDERSDYGQILRELWLGSDTSAVRLRAGPLRRVSLGRGLLVSRYSNQLNPDYHPLGAVVTVDAGPVHAQVLASDVLAARLFAVELTGDVADFMGAAEQRGRYHLTFTAGHDFGAVNAASPHVTLMLVEADALLYDGSALRAFAYGAIGSRLLTVDFALGGLLGLSADADVSGTQVGLKLEGRKVGGGFRFGMFGPSYELGRFSDIGLTQTGTSAARLPDSFSAYSEVQLDLGRAVVLSAAAEYFSFNRLDVDAALSMRAFGDAATLTARFTLVGFNQVPRYQGSGELRYRFAPSFYAIGQGGLVFFPQPDQTLTRGFFAGVGVGADFSN